jgi:hypothetical protein
MHTNQDFPHETPDMIAPETPVDEPQRLEKLRALNILDSAPEERFDRLTRMARKMFGVDVSVVTLVDQSRQWFKSKAEDNNLPNENQWQRAGDFVYF